MSLLTLGSVAIGRDLAGQGDPLAKDATVSKTRLVLAGDQTTEPPTTGLADTPTASVASFGQLLVAQIPSEALIAYTTLLALFSASGGSYTTALWVVYGAAILVCAVAVLAGYLGQRDYAFDDTGGAQGTTTTTTGRADRVGISAAIGIGHRVRTLVRLPGRRRGCPDVSLRAAPGQGKRRQRHTQIEVARLTEGLTPPRRD
jgi:hypothetical protein